MSEKILPLYDKIVVELIEQEEKTIGGIIIPDSAKEKPFKGKVIAVGQGRINNACNCSPDGSNENALLPLTVKEGDIVVFAKWGGTELNINDKNYLIVKEDDVLAIVK